MDVNRPDRFRENLSGLSLGLALRVYTEFRPRGGPSDRKVRGDADKNSGARLIMTATIDWLLDGPPWVQYCTRLDLLGQTDRSAEVKAARQALLAHPQVQALVSELAGWPGPPLTRHNDASHLL